MRSDAIFKFINERQAVYQRRKDGYPKPWTDDPILQRYKFCNVYRELDRVTIWIRENWRKPYEHAPMLWFAMAVARYINWPDTLEAIGYPIPFNAARVSKILKQRKERGEQVFTGAYFINSIGPKIDSVVFDRLNVMWQGSRETTFKIDQCHTLQGLYGVLSAQFGFGSFMAGQVIADLKFAPRWRKAPDWKYWAIPGPGSKRGLNRVYGRPVNAPWGKSANWHSHLHALQAEITPRMQKINMVALSAQDLQGCLCEFDKYERVRLGEGKPRSLYPGV